MSDTEFISGLDDLMANIEKLDRLKEEFGKEALTRVKAYSPVDTGLLQASWQLSIDADGNIDIQNTALNHDGQYYAPFLEWGTIHIRPFLMATRTVAEAEDIMRVAKSRSGL